MNALVTHNLEKIAELCRKHGVKRLELFGSAARDDFDPARSDVDFMVEFFPYEPQGFGDKYFVMMRELEGLSYEEMVQAMSCSKGTIMSRLFHARRNMQKRLLDLHENPSADLIADLHGAGDKKTVGDDAEAEVAERAPAARSR